MDIRMQLLNLLTAVSILRPLILFEIASQLRREFPSRSGIYEETEVTGVQIVNLIPGQAGYHEGGHKHNEVIVATGSHVMGSGWSLSSLHIALSCPICAGNSTGIPLVYPVTGGTKQQLCDAVAAVVEDLLELPPDKKLAH